MPNPTPDPVPASPEEQPPAVREELHQANVTHEGRRERPGASPDDHLGANELDVTPVTPPMRGPGNLVGPEAPGDAADPGPGGELLDPKDEITPG